MSTYKKTFIIISSIIVIIFITITAILWPVRGDWFFIGYNKFFLAPSCNTADNFLQTNAKELSYITEKLFDMNYDNITIGNSSIYEKSEYSMRVKRKHLVYETIPVPDELINCVNSLFECGVQNISCGRDTVNFTIWSTMDESRGIIYSNTGEKPDGEQLIEVSQLSKTKWYFYVHNYEKAKERTPEKFT